LHLGPCTYPQGPFFFYPQFAKFYPEELKHVATQEQLRILASKVELIADGSEFFAEGDNNQSYSYGKEEFPDTQPDISAQEWIGFMPDYYD
jgi:hypothetical protein